MMDIVSIVRENLLSKVDSDAHKELLKDFWESEAFKKTGSSVDYSGVVSVLNEFNRKGISVEDKSLFALEIIEDVLSLQKKEIGKDHSKVSRAVDAFFVEFLKYPVLPAFLMRKHTVKKGKGAVGYLKAVIDSNESIDSPKNKWLVDEFKKNGYPAGGRCDSKKTERQVDAYVARERARELRNVSKPGEFDFDSLSESKPEPAEAEEVEKIEQPEPVEPEPAEPVKSEEEQVKIYYSILEGAKQAMSLDFLAFKYEQREQPDYFRRACLWSEWSALKEWGDKEIEDLCPLMTDPKVNE